MARLTDDPPHVQAAVRAAVVGAPRGIGTLASYGTEVPLPATGTWNAPGRGGARADIVVTAPQDRVPLLFIGVDNCHESAEELAGKLEKYIRFFLRKVKDTDGRSARCGAPAGPLRTPGPATRRSRPSCWCSTASVSATPTAPSRTSWS
ncbi:hypothetical protein [Streptomyces beigongshangae]|uniref:hypothetical protein n=1 Tax=Streptomyces beigongshangae TaxID=2841597 RepID=UPI0021A7F410|nr:hypothetical protein [Streptomyces sp. REN17]